jgi:peptidoglycan hydrolase-like protein with peptidoglycan-binding domain
MQELRQGDSGNDVRLLQRLLRDLNYDVGDIDGDFGPRTEAALTAYQRDANLDSIQPGVCGTATWASLEGQFGPLEGLRDPDNVEEYAADAYGIWNSSRSADDRIAALASAVNAQLADAGVPWVDFELDPSTAPYAVFRFRTWTAAVEPTPFQPENAERLSPHEQGQISGAVYHEARHAEQWWTIARLLAGLHDLDGAAIAAQTGIRSDIAALAAQDPIRECTMSNGPAFDWYESVYGGGAANRNAVLGTLGDGDPTNDRYTEYRDGTLPEESDAWDTGGNVAREMRDYGSGGDAADRPTLRRDSDEAGEVRYLQQLLQWRGYYTTHTVDGDFGPDTEEAVKQFQRANGLDDDGVVGRGTWERLVP